MRKFVFIMLTAALPALAACADSSTLPSQEQRAPDVTVAGPMMNDELQGCVSDGVCILEPVSPAPCDPWMDLNWCEGDGGSCMTSVGPEQTLQACPGPGGGAPGSGGAPPPPPSSDPGTICPAAATSTCPDPVDPCDPRYDPTCNQPLTRADSATLKAARQRHLRPASEFTDPAAAQMCGQLINAYDQLFNSGNVYRGGSETAPGDPHTPLHVALYEREGGTMHFEPSALDAANAGDAAAIRNVFNSALHEAAHSLGYTHSDPLWAGDYDLYAESPFDLLSPGTNSCITNW